MCSIEHVKSRRSFIGLGGIAVGSLWAPTAAIGLGGMFATQPAIASEFKRGAKRVLQIYLHGGVSQLETWDPKPNTDTGGPFRAIPTSVPGIHISELLPYTAQQMHHLSLIRSLNTRNSDHGRGHTEMTTGKKQIPGTDYPHLGAVVAKSLTPDDFTLPGISSYAAPGRASTREPILVPSIRAS